MKSQKVNKVDGYQGTGRTLNDEELQLVCGGTAFDGEVNGLRIPTPTLINDPSSDSGSDGDDVVLLQVA